MRTVAAAAALLLAAGTVCANDGAQSELALAVARVAAHEGALTNVRDVDLIWQVVRGHGADARERLRWLRQHSPRALGLVPTKAWDGNGWSAELSPRALVPASVAAGGDAQLVGYWRAVALPRWRLVLSRAQDLVARDVADGPCPSQPYSWGGVGRVTNGADDREAAAARGLFPLGCRGTSNDGFAFRLARERIGF